MDPPGNMVILSFFLIFICAYSICLGYHLCGERLFLVGKLQMPFGGIKGGNQK